MCNPESDVYKVARRLPCQAFKVIAIKHQSCHRTSYSPLYTYRAAQKCVLSTKEPLYYVLRNAATFRSIMVHSFRIGCM